MAEVEVINLNKGTVNIWVAEGIIDYDGNKFVQLFYHNQEDGTLKIIKDKDNGLKVYYIYMGNKCLLNSPVENLEDNDKHMVTVTWSLEERKLKLYIDGELEEEGEIEVSPF